MGDVLFDEATQRWLALPRSQQHRRAARRDVPCCWCGRLSPRTTLEHLLPLRLIRLGAKVETPLPLLLLACFGCNNRRGRLLGPPPDTDLGGVAGRAWAMGRAWWLPTGVNLATDGRRIGPRRPRLGELLELGQLDGVLLVEG